MAKKKKRKRRAPVNPSMLNCHHILWQARHWDNGYAKALRNHEYMKKMIPRDTLHKEIHSEISDIPMPSGKLCEKAYREIERLYREELIDFDYDSIETRIDVLLQIWAEDDCEPTKAMLRKERAIAHNFYSQGK